MSRADRQPLSVSVQPGGKKRPILDFRYVNKFLVKKHVKYEDWKVAMPYFDIGSFMFTIDLRNGYHHIEIFYQHQIYLGFSWTYNSSKETKLYKFTVLRLDFRPPLTFLLKYSNRQKDTGDTRTYALPYYYRRWLGLISKNVIESKSASNIAKNDLANAGFVSKSAWEPCQTITCLGIVLNSGNGTIAISERRLENISATIDSIIDLDFVVSARKLTSFTGQIISTGPSIGNISRILTRHLSNKLRHIKLFTRQGHHNSLHQLLWVTK